MLLRWSARISAARVVASVMSGSNLVSALRRLCVGYAYGSCERSCCRCDALGVWSFGQPLDLNAEVDDSQPATPVGHSVGHWEGDTLVVTTTNVDWPYYSGDGTPQSDQVSYLERFSVSDDGKTLNYSITIDDPVIFTEPFTMDRTREAAPGIVLEPFNCIFNWEDAAG